MKQEVPSLSQVYAISSVEQTISILYDDRETRFKEILEVVDKNNLAELEDMMLYLHGLLASKGYQEQAEEFAKRYNLRIEEVSEEKRVTSIPYEPLL
jgi:hypothetical protein